jgi:hypothetical protein
VSWAGRRALRARVPASFGIGLAGRGAQTARGEPALPRARVDRVAAWSTRTPPHAAGRRRASGRGVPPGPLPRVVAGGLPRVAVPTWPVRSFLARGTESVTAGNHRSPGSRRPGRCHRLVLDSLAPRAAWVAPGNHRSPRPRRPVAPTRPILGLLAPRAAWVAPWNYRPPGPRRRVDPRLRVEMHHPGVDEVRSARRGAPVGYGVVTALSTPGGPGRAALVGRPRRSLGARIDREPPRSCCGIAGWLGRSVGVLRLVRIACARGHPHVPSDGVGCVVSPDRVGSRYGWVLPGCGVAVRPLPELIHRRRLTVPP